MILPTPTLRPVLLSISLLVLAASCGDDADNTPSVADAGTATAITWHEHVAPIVHEKCVGCHNSDDGVAPFPLETFDEAGPKADFMLSNIEAGIMPPWSAASADDCSPWHDWKNDARLTDSQQKVIADWVAGGALEGDASTASVLPAKESFELARVTHTLRMDPYTTSGTKDELLCFVLDPELQVTSYMTGMQIEPTNLEVTHHATLSVVPPASAQIIRDQAGADGLFPCAGIPQVAGAYSLGVWVPGSRPFETPANTGTPIAPGSVIVLNMHYHPTRLDHDPDQTKVKLRLTETAPDDTFLFVSIGNVGEAPILQPGPGEQGQPQFLIPAGVADHRESMVFEVGMETMGEQIPIVAVFPHMHYVGEKMKVTIERAQPTSQESSECLVNIPRWDFNWQRTYSYNAPLAELPTLTMGDKIVLTCDYNNSIDNPFVQRMLDEEGLSAPIDIGLGEETTDEMCVAILGLILPRAPTP